MFEQKQKELFRKVSLERLSSPEQLDMLTRVTTPTGWLSLVILGLILVMALIWGFLGNIPIKVKGQGILLSQGGVASVVTMGAGQVTEVVVQVNDIVRRGQVVARIAQPALLDQLHNAKNELADAKSQHQRLYSFSAKDSSFQGDATAAQTATIRTSIKTYEKRIVFLNGQLAKQQALLEKGLIIPAKVEATRQEISSVQEQIAAQNIKIDELKAQSQTQKNRNTNMTKESEFKINGMERNISMMENKLTNDSRVISKGSGKVIEVKVSPGSVVNVGTPIISLEQQEKKIEAVFYVSAADGKKIRPGMEIDVAPTSVKKEEHGYMLGLVTSVSEYPATYQGMVQVLENEQLAKTLAGDSASYEVRAELIPDSKTISGFKWSSGKGPAVAVQSGTVCQGEVVVENKTPIMYVIPYVKKKLGL